MNDYIINFLECLYDEIATYKYLKIDTDKIISLARMEILLEDIKAELEKEKRKVI